MVEMRQHPIGHNFPSFYLYLCSGFNIVQDSSAVFFFLAYYIYFISIFIIKPSTRFLCRPIFLLEPWDRSSQKKEDGRRISYYIKPWTKIQIKRWKVMSYRVLSHFYHIYFLLPVCNIHVHAHLNGYWQ
jgi:hypothetical protein